MSAVARPDWPALMDAQTAASYLSCSVDTMRGVTARAGVKPVDMGISRLRWRRKDLDALVDSLRPRGAPMASEGAPEPDPANDALAAVERRIAAGAR